MKRRYAIFLFLIALPAATQVAAVTLRVEHGTAPGDVFLHWTGGEPTFEIFRSADPSGVGHRNNEVGG